VTNANDESVNNSVVAEFEQLWKEHGEENLEVFQFDKSLELPHDLITPTRPGARIDLVYPKLLELIRLDSGAEGSNLMVMDNLTKPKSVTELEAIYGAPSQAAFGSAVFYEKLKNTDDLEQVALEKYRYFTGDLWERYGEEAWIGPWKAVYARVGDARHDIVAELRSIKDPDAALSVPMILENIEGAEKARLALSAVYDDPSLTELQVYNLGDGEAMSGLLIAGRNMESGEMVFLVFLLD
jgi:hypothetical protein